MGGLWFWVFYHLKKKLPVPVYGFGDKKKKNPYNKNSTFFFSSNSEFLFFFLTGSMALKSTIT